MKKLALAILLFAFPVFGQVEIGMTIANTTSTPISFINTSTLGFWHQPASGAGALYLGPASDDLVALSGKDGYFQIRYYDGGWTVPLSCDNIAFGFMSYLSGMNLHLATDVEMVGKASIGDSLRVGSSGKYIRKIFESTTGDSIGFVYYNTTRVRADTVWLIQ